MNFFPSSVTKYCCALLFDSRCRTSIKLYFVRNSRYCWICFEFRLHRYIIRVFTAPFRHSKSIRFVISIQPRFRFIDNSRLSTSSYVLNIPGAPSEEARSNSLENLLKTGLPPCNCRNIRVRYSCKRELIIQTQLQNFIGFDIIDCGV